MSTNVCSILIHRSPKLEIAQMSVSSRMEKQIVSYPYNGTHQSNLKNIYGETEQHR